MAKPSCPYLNLPLFWFCALFPNNVLESELQLLGFGSYGNL